MKKVMLLCGMLIALTATAASAAPGVNLRWVNCFGDAGTSNRNSTCLSNAGTNALVGSFEMGSDLLGVTGIEVILDLAAADASLPAWWAFIAAGSCRQASLTANGTISLSAANCLDWAEGAAFGGVAAYQVGLAGPNTARIKGGFAVAAGVGLFGAQEYFGMNVLITNAKTVGTGACAGCLTPVCIVFNSCNVVPGTNAGRLLTGPTNGTDSNFATWQGGGGVSTGRGNGCPAATPTRNTTWGSVKSLYR